MKIKVFEPGDIVTGYHKGYWKVLGMKGHIVEYQRIDAKSVIKKSCDGGWCNKIDPETLLTHQLNEAHALYDLLKKAQAV